MHKHRLVFGSYAVGLARNLHAGKGAVVEACRGSNAVQKSGNEDIPALVAAHKFGYGAKLGKIEGDFAYGSVKGALGVHAVQNGGEHLQMPVLLFRKAVLALCVHAQGTA